MTERFSVVVPVYGNETTICELKDRLTATFERMSVADFELIFVDDAGPDGSWALIEAMAAADPKVVGLRLASNVGQPMAYCAGIDIAQGDLLIGIDADLEHPPEAIPRLVAPLRDGHDLVAARRVGRSPGTVRLIGSRTVNLLARVLRLPVSDVGSAYLVVTPEVAAAIRGLIERTGRQMLLPAFFEHAARNPTAIDVEMAISPTSAYTLRRAAGLFAEFIAAVLAPALARPTLVAGGGTLLLAVDRRVRRPALVAGATLIAAGLVGLAIPRAFRRDRTIVMYEVAERVGRGLAA